MIDAAPQRVLPAPHAKRPPMTTAAADRACGLTVAQIVQDLGRQFRASASAPRARVIRAAESRACGLSEAITPAVLPLPVIAQANTSSTGERRRNRVGPESAWDGPIQIFDTANKAGGI